MLTVHASEFLFASKFTASKCTYVSTCKLTPYRNDH